MGRGQGARQRASWCQPPSAAGSAQSLGSGATGVSIACMPSRTRSPEPVRASTEVGMSRHRVHHTWDHAACANTHLCWAPLFVGGVNEGARFVIGGVVKDHLLTVRGLFSCSRLKSLGNEPGVYRAAANKGSFIRPLIRSHWLAKQPAHARAAAAMLCLAGKMVEVGGPPIWRHVISVR